MTPLYGRQNRHGVWEYRVRTLGHSGQIAEKVGHGEQIGLGASKKIALKQGIMMVQKDADTMWCLPSTLNVNVKRFI